VSDLAVWGEHVAPYSGDSATVDGFRDLANTAVGALLSNAVNENRVMAVQKSLDLEMELRLSLNLFLSTPPTAKRVAIVQGGFSAEFRKDLFGAAAGLGVRLVILDHDGHWSQDREDLREFFLPIDMTVDAGLAMRIVGAVRGLELAMDGITTFADQYLPATAEAAVLLGLPGEPKDAFNKCVDKYLFRNDTGCARTISTSTEARTLSADIVYPQILKPVSGAGSADVYIALDAHEMLSVSSRMFASGIAAVLVEPYVGGPEVDVNVVLQAGHVIFCEVNDDFPKSAECSTYHGPSTFQETLNVLPSRLPVEEQDLLRAEAHAALQRLGFASGIFHVEARVRNSRMRYEQDPYSGILDLRREAVSAHAIQAPAEVYLIEVNARPPGLQWSTATMLAYGVDFQALQLLIACNDTVSVRTMSTPFRVPGYPLEHWSAFFLPVVRGGEYWGGDLFKLLEQRRPYLSQHIFEPAFFFRNGDQIKDPTSGRQMFLGSCLIKDASRQQLLAIEKKIRKELTAYAQQSILSAGSRP